ncbi:trypsin beta-like [Ceratitis capitata]|uniref:trypsin beta-like n=1 Tax=Ceratitis capitata TaxID=7213 RepID=UPI000329CD4C|nr:trypsin beta-like [Ceratitis capitata]
MRVTNYSCFILLISVVSPSSAAKQNNGRNKTSLVIGGRKVPRGGAPWQVSIIQNFHLKCGGTLLTNDVVLTAASCIKDVEPAELLVRAGTTAFKTGGKLRKVRETVYHPKFVENRHSYNIALLHLKRAFNSTNKLFGEVELFDATAQPPSSVYIYGWGLSSNKTDTLMTKNLRFTKAKVYSEKKCAEYLLEEDDSDLIFCAGDRTKISDICTDDMGSPAIINGNIQYGIVSDGGACSATRTTIFTNVGKHASWVERLIAEFSDENVNE